MTPRRLDLSLLEHGLATSRTHARRIIEEGRARLDGAPAPKPSTPVPDGARLEVVDVPAGGEYASRAAHKLLGALELSGLTPEGLRCLDAGSSTGGFTDVLLRRGARRVVAVDIGHEQLIPRLREDPRVDVHEGTSIRGLDPRAIGGPAQLVVGDLSFISLRTLMADLAGLTAGTGDLLLMVKPQFEVGRSRLPRSGVVTDPALQREAVVGVVEEALRRGLELVAVAPSPLAGQDGNREFFVHLRPGAGAPPAVVPDGAAPHEVRDPRPAGAPSTLPGVPYDMIEQAIAGPPADVRGDHRTTEGARRA